MSPSQYAFLFVFSFAPLALICHHFINKSYSSISGEGKESTSNSSIDMASRLGY
jgi:hypothetical protein